MQGSKLARRAVSISPLSSHKFGRLELQLRESFNPGGQTGADAPPPPTGAMGRVPSPARLALLRARRWRLSTASGNHSRDTFIYVSFAQPYAGHGKRTQPGSVLCAKGVQDSIGASYHGVTGLAAAWATCSREERRQLAVVWLEKVVRFLISGLKLEQA